MSKEALSQSEIDALLSQTQAKQDNQNEAVTTKGKAVFAYNFRKQKKFNKSQFVLLEGIHKRFLRNIEVTLTNLLNTPVMATLAAATELTYNDCTDSFSSPTCLYLLNINDGMGKFLLEIDPKFAFFVIDKILGGSGKEMNAMDRELSLIEEKIMFRVVKLLNQDLKEAWDRIDSFKIEIEGFYAQPDYVQVIGNMDAVILISMDVRKAENVLGYLNFCIPSDILERLLEKYDRTSDRLQRTKQQYSDARKDIEHQISDAILPIKAILGETQMKVSELLNLRTGDIIFLHSEANKPIDIFVGDLKLYKGLPIKKENSMMVKISEIIRQKGFV
ncbi:MAG: flagellar motor switch protein FliM [bacterium]